ncbi:helix-turn-helix domain-containing protein [Streptomyces sp. NPDC001658]
MPRSTPPDARVLVRRRQVGEQIRRVRLSLNLTQTQVCDRTGIDIASYSRIEQGHVSARLDTLIRIAIAMDVDVAELVR